MPATTHVLTEEMNAYEAHLAEWAAQEGKFVVIRRAQVLGFFGSYDAALRAGYDAFGIVPFLVKPVRRHKEIHLVTRMIAPHLPRG